MGGRSLTRIADGPIIDQLNAAWLAAYPHQAQPLVPASLNDDGMLLWFSNGDRTELADQFATAFLQRGPVETTQIAPTILALHPGALQPSPPSAPRRCPAPRDSPAGSRAAGLGYLAE